MKHTKVQRDPSSTILIEDEEDTGLKPAWHKALEDMQPGDMYEERVSTGAMYSRYLERANKKKPKLI